MCRWAGTSINARPAVMLGVAPPGSVPSSGLAAVALVAAGEGVPPTEVVPGVAESAAASVALVTLGALPLM